MGKLTITYDIAHAASTDAANAHMRKHGRTQWNEDDYDVAVQVMCRLLDQIEYPHAQPGGVRVQSI